MPASEMHLIKSSIEYLPKSDIGKLRRGIRGIYVLYKEISKPGVKRPNLDVMYVGMTSGGTSGVRARLDAHRKSKRKGDLWTHFSIFEVWDNIRDEEIAELEGLFRHLFKRDSNANALNAQRAYRPLWRVRKATAESLLSE